MNKTNEKEKEKKKTNAFLVQLSHCYMGQI